MLSQALAQVTLCPDAKKFVDRDEIKELFQNSMEELDSIWSKTAYAGKQVKVINSDPSTAISAEDAFNVYEKVKDALSKRERAQISKTIIEPKLDFYGRANYIHFTKRQRSYCEHCEGTITHEGSLNLLKDISGSFSALLKPVLMNSVYGGEHYPCFLDYQELATLLKKSSKRFRNKIRMLKNVRVAIGMLAQKMRRSIIEFVNMNCMHKILNKQAKSTCKLCLIRRV